MPEFEEIPIGTTLAEPPPPATGPSSSGPPTIDTAPLADIQERKMAATRGIQDQTFQRLEADRQRAERALEATGIGPDELQKWDHEQMSERYRTDPLEAFGSLGSVFAMVASAFTRAPMDNALNGAAAAMNAVRAGDEKEFQRAFDAWKANTDLAIKRHNIQQQYYTNATNMLNTNMVAGRAQMEMVATRFGDEKTLFLLRNGLDKEAIELQSQRAQAVSRMEEANQKITLNSVRTDLWNKELQEINQTIEDPVQAAAHKLAAFNRIYGKSGTPQQEAMGLLLHEMRDKPADEIIQRAQQLGILPRAGGVLTRDRMGAEEIERRRQQYEKENVATGMGAEEARVEAFRRATREVDTEMARMTGGQISTLEGQSDAYKYSIETIDRLVPAIKSKLALGGPVGTPGYLKRAGEIIGNLVGGSNSTEYQQIASDIALLKTWAMRNLLGRDGRPLSAEHENLNRIIQGLGMTDTAQNTIKTFEKIRALYLQMQQDIERRRTRTRSVPGPTGTTAGPTPAPAAPARAPSWSDAIPVQ